MCKNHIILCEILYWIRVICLFSISSRPTFDVIHRTDYQRQREKQTSTKIYMDTNINNNKKSLCSGRKVSTGVGVRVLRSHSRIT